VLIIIYGNNGEHFYFSSIEHFLFICTKIFVLIRVNVENDEIFDLSLIELFLFKALKYDHYY